MRTETKTIYEKEDYEFAEDPSLEKVIAALEYIKRGYIPDYNFTGDAWDFDHYCCHMAMKKAIEIVKQEMQNEIHRRNR